MQHLFIIFFVFALFSCNEQNNASFPTPDPEADAAVFKKEIPATDGIDDLFYTLKKQKEKQLKLDSLESGYDSLQIRIWYDYSRIIERELIVIKRTKGKWSAVHYEMTVNWDSFKNTETIMTNKIKSLTPKSGWNKFINDLLSLKIMTLPHMYDIPGLIDGWKDGVGYNIEIATKKQYRFYSYHVPEEFGDKYWQAKNMAGIIKLISTELKE